MWCIQEITPEYRKRMYAILDLYQEPYDPQRPVIGIDEKPKQLLADKRKAIPMRPGKPEKYDYEYTRNGTANIFMAVEPKGGKRIVKVTNRRTKKDFCDYMCEVVSHYQGAIELRIVLDNLNTHFKKSFYENMAKKAAEKILRKITFYYTPTHASWLNVAEMEIAAMDAQCTNRRIKDISFLKEEVKFWVKRRNKDKCKIDWKFTREEADRKLAKHYVA